MKNYNELVIKPSGCYDLYLDLLMDLTDESIEEDGTCIILRTYDDVETIKEALVVFKESLSEHFGQSIECEIVHRVVADEDWIAKYQKSIEPIEVGNFYVRPTWCEPVANKIEIIIDPALAFGSGHHETTSSCLKLIEKYAKAGSTLLDVGCGSGILAIGAAKLGGIVEICDTDILAIENATKNFELNQVKFANAWEGSASLSKNTYDVVVANIVADVLVFISNDLKKALKKDGILIMSGILVVHKDKVLAKFAKYDVVEEIILGDWYSVVLKEKING